MSKSSPILGIALICIGVAGFFNYFLGVNYFSMARLWPLFLLVPGIAFEYVFFVHKQNVGLLVPGGILCTLGLTFLVQTFTNWHFAAYCWPLYVLSPAVGLFQLYYFGERQAALLIPIGILTLVTILGFFNISLLWIGHSFIWPAILVIIGLVLLFNPPKQKTEDTISNDPFIKNQ